MFPITHVKLRRSLTPLIHHYWYPFLEIIEKVLIVIPSHLQPLISIMNHFLIIICSYSNITFPTWLFKFIILDIICIVSQVRYFSEIYTLFFKFLIKISLEIDKPIVVLWGLLLSYDFGQYSNWLWMVILLCI